MLGWAFTWLLGIELGSLGFHVASTSRLSCFPSTLCVRAPVDTCVDVTDWGGTVYGIQKLMGIFCDNYFISEERSHTETQAYIVKMVYAVTLHWGSLFLCTDHRDTSRPPCLPIF